MSERTGEMLELRKNSQGNASIRPVGSQGMIAPWIADGYARRVVACWNACAGIMTEQLEIEPYIGSVSYKMRMQAEKRRDELLAALQELADRVEEYIILGDQSTPDTSRARAAIARAES